MDDLMSSWVDACKALHTTKLRFINLTNLEIIITISIAGITYGQGTLPSSDSFSESLLASVDLDCSHVFYDVDIYPVYLAMSHSGVFAAARITAAGGSVIIVTFSNYKKEFELIDLGRAKEMMLISESIVRGMTYRGIVFEPIDATSFFDEDNIERIKMERDKQKSKGYAMLKSFDDDGNNNSNNNGNNRSSFKSPKKSDSTPGKQGLASAKGRYDN